MADIKRLLNKKGWTGREMGILEITNMCVLYRQLLAGEERNPLIDEAQFQKMLSDLEPEQGRIYNGYVSIHTWITTSWNMAQTQRQQFLRTFATLCGYIERAELVEDIYGYAEQLPVVMTQKQYDDFRAERIEAQLQDREGSHVFHLVAQAINFYLAKLEKEPGKPNPLKAIRKKYAHQPLKSELILSRWNDIWGEGYYTIEDGSGRRSDEMTKEEWRAAVLPEWLRTERHACDACNLTPGRWCGTCETGRQFLERAEVFYRGGTEEDADKAQMRKNYEAGLFAPVKWHCKEEPPADLVKWDAVEAGVWEEFYPETDEDLTDHGNMEKAIQAVKDFVAEFPELAEAMLKDIDKRYFKGERGLSGLPVEEWVTTEFSGRQLYEKDFYGERAFVEKDSTIFTGNSRAMFNGIAILKPSDYRSFRIDERGYYREPEIKTTLEHYTLEGLFTEAENFADHVRAVETSRRQLTESYLFLKAHNYALELVSRVFDIPETDVFSVDLAMMERRIQAFNNLVPLLYERIQDIRYEDASLKAKKLQVLKDLFQPIDYEAIELSEEGKEAAEKLIRDGFRAFEGADSIQRALLYTVPKEA